MNSFIDDLTPEQLDGDSRELAEVIGIEAFKKLVEVYGGSSVLYVPNFIKFTRYCGCDRRACAGIQFGQNSEAAGRKYQLSERRVHQIIQRYKVQEAAQDG